MNPPNNSKKSWFRHWNSFFFHLNYLPKKTYQVEFCSLLVFIPFINAIFFHNRPKLQSLLQNTAEIREPPIQESIRIIIRFPLFFYYNKLSFEFWVLFYKYFCAEIDILALGWSKYWCGVFQRSFEGKN